jgi:glycosyltransferase involved in cell wall biosynthesis
VSAPRVSAIMPVRDGERYIAEALDSMLAQTRPPDEIVVVDDGSTDGTASIVAGYAEPVRLIRREPRGVGAAINTALDAISGDVVCFLDADDLWTPGKLAAQCAALERGRSEIVFGHVTEFVSPELDKGEAAKLQPAEGPVPGKVKGAMLITGAALRRVGSFETRWARAEFVDWYARATEAAIPEEMIDDVVLRRRLHKDNIGRRLSHAADEYAEAIAHAIRRRRRSGARPPAD